jgi:hypothetical protein
MRVVYGCVADSPVFLQAAIGTIVRISRTGTYEGMAIDYQPVGSTTWKRKNVKRGVESDLLEKSQFLPIKPADVARWVLDEEEPGRPVFKRRLRDWARNELV